MNRSRTAAVSLTALLAMGGTTALTTGIAAAQTDPSTTTSTTVAAPSAPTDIAITLPGLGDIALSVDPTTGAIVSLTVTPIDGVTVADPVPVHNGVQLDFTLADGTVVSKVVEVKVRDGAVEVEIEAADDEVEDQQHSGPPPIDQRGESAEHRNDDNEHSQGLHLGTSTTVDGAATVRVTPPTQSHDDDERSTSTMQQNRSGSSSNGRGGSRD